MKIELNKLSLMLLTLSLLLGCKEDDAIVIPVVELGESFYLEPGDSVMFTDPIPITFTLDRFEETEKLEGYYPYADFWYQLYSEKSSTESVTRIQQANVPNETPFFSACFGGFPFQDEFNPIPMRWIIEEVKFAELEDRFVFKGITMRFYLEADFNGEECQP